MAYIRDSITKFGLFLRELKLFNPSGGSLQVDQDQDPMPKTNILRAARSKFVTQQKGKRSKFSKANTEVCDFGCFGFGQLINTSSGRLSVMQKTLISLLMWYVVLAWKLGFSSWTTCILATLIVNSQKPSPPKFPATTVTTLPEKKYWIKRSHKLNRCSKYAELQILTCQFHNWIKMHNFDEKFSHKFFLTFWMRIMPLISYTFDYR